MAPAVAADLSPASSECDRVLREYGGLPALTLFRPAGETATLTADYWPAQQQCRAALEDGEHDRVAGLGSYGTAHSSRGVQ